MESSDAPAAAAPSSSPAASGTSRAYFRAPHDAVVAHKPYSLELHCTLRHGEGDHEPHGQPNLVKRERVKSEMESPGSETETRVRFTLAVKFSPTKPAKRTHLQTDMAAVWAACEKRTEVKEDSAPSASPVASHAAADSSSVAPLSASAQMKLENARGDRSIGQHDILFVRPSPNVLPSASPLTRVIGSLHLCYKPVQTEEDWLEGSLVHVQTIGRAYSAAQRAQRYVHFQSNHAYALDIPTAPPPYELRVDSLQLRTWRNVTRELELAPTIDALPMAPPSAAAALHDLAAGPPSTPPPPKRSHKRRQPPPGEEAAARPLPTPTAFSSRTRAATRLIQMLDVAQTSPAQASAAEVRAAAPPRLPPLSGSSYSYQATATDYYTAAVSSVAAASPELLPALPLDGGMMSVAATPARKRKWDSDSSAATPARPVSAVSATPGLVTPKPKHESVGKRVKREPKTPSRPRSARRSAPGAAAASVLQAQDMSHMAMAMSMPYTYTPPSLLGVLPAFDLTPLSATPIRLTSHAAAAAALPLSPGDVPTLVDTSASSHETTHVSTDTSGHDFSALTSGPSSLSPLLATPEHGPQPATSPALSPIGMMTPVSRLLNAGVSSWEVDKENRSPPMSHSSMLAMASPDTGGVAGSATTAAPSRSTADALQSNNWLLNQSPPRTIAGSSMLSSPANARRRFNAVHRRLLAEAATTTRTR